MSTRGKRMRSQPRWFYGALVPIATGLLWMAVGWHTGIGLGLLASLPGVLLLASGGALLLWPGDRQISHYMAFGALLSLLVSLGAMALASILTGLLFILLGIASYLVAGYAALFQEVLVEGAPEPRQSLKMARKVALDEALLAYFLASARVPTGDEVNKDRADLEHLQSLHAEHGWDNNPRSFHQTPPPPDDATLSPRKVGRRRFEHLRFTSGYQPRPELPGGEAWLAAEANRNMHAWVFRHEDGPRPWLLGIHGYRMGHPRVDMSLFDVDYLHRQLGLNLILPILPLHGPRKTAFLSGTGFLDGAMAPVIHAEAQAAWDLRRTLAWLRSTQDATTIGVLGFSLGGYNSALLAGLDSDLACVIAGIPLTDITDIFWRHLPLLHLRYIETRGMSSALVHAAMRPISPLALAPLIEPQRRYLFAATGDQLVPPDQPLRLWRHWDEPSCCWYQGAHLSVRREQSVHQFIGEALGASGLVEDTQQRHAAAHS